MVWFAYALAYDLIWDSPLTREVARCIVDSSATDGLIVDLGCGTGLVAVEFLRNGLVVIGVDASSRMLRRALRRSRISTAVLSGADHTRINSGVAATVLLSNVLHLHPDPAAILAEAVRIAGPGAHIVIATPTESASNDLLARTDLALGRSWQRTLLADQLRRLVALMAWILRLRRTEQPNLDRAIDDAVRANSLVRLSVRTMFECQRVTVLLTPM
ncbi:MAG: Methyltransferase type 11 [Glaciihabitans sp.]|jgi:SAM-dependent methyltransferase|nr:Methyltransferase type 11 [Glaciihabitans sp.]